MGRLLRQSIKHKKLKIWKLILMVIVILLVMEIILNLTIGFGPVIASLLALIAVLIGSVFCFAFIYKDLSKFDYKLIDNELILERSLGRANHVVYNIFSDDLLSIISYNNRDTEKKIPWLNYLTSDNNKDNWYIISYRDGNDEKQLVIEPNEEFLDELIKFAKLDTNQVKLDINNAKSDKIKDNINDSINDDI